MRFLPDPDRLVPSPAPDHPVWRRLLFVGAAVTALATMWPWVTVQFERLWGEHAGPPGWQSSAGFTCLCTSMMVAVMALAETSTPSSREAVRPGSLLLSALALGTLAFEGWAGPGTLRGVSAAWTAWFFLACAGAPLLLAACACRWLLHRRRAG